MTEPNPATAEIGYQSVFGICSLLERRSVTSLEIVETLLRRVEHVDTRGPALHAVVVTCPDGVETARMLDAERRQGRLRGPLHGVPALVKDNIDTAGAEGTTAGSMALAMSRPRTDATVVKRLRKAGVIVIGKANLSEWANFRDRHSSSGWSATGGQCLNPHVLDRSPGGSSSGSAAGVAGGFAPLALGTETDGSILCPAALNGVVGIKPTVGLTSRAGVVPISSSQDTVGPIARSVTEAAALLGVLAGHGSGADPLDPVTMTRPSHLPKDYTVFCDQGGLSGVRIGIPRRHYFGYSGEADTLVEAALKVAQEAGAVMVDPADVVTAGAIAESGDEMTVMLHEYRAGVEDYLAARPSAAGQPRTVAEVVAFNRDHATEELAFFGQDILVTACEVGGLDDPAYLEALARNRRRARQDGIDAALQSARAGLLAFPTMGPAWRIDHVNGDPHNRAGYQAAAVAGYPAISLPVGKAGGLPVGLCLVGTAWSEPILIRVAFALEQRLALGRDMRPAWSSRIA